ncbi:hypothetical protein E4K66_21915 [Bradyrhizobium frederickii]|uniref:DUF4760 domain-containing protein n=2 Tax=Bradyrhizobium frederickii TaxID=2560054 RepID=A0A4Y9L3R8_9BRAD|nr:hypothetical protein E4K66_21915 [Bradyrhizobium frederickii]
MVDIRAATGDRSDLVSAMYISALAAFGGSAFGAVSTILSGWFGRRRRLRERHHARSFSKRERLYRSFIEEASRLYADALVNDRAEIPQLVGFYTLVGRMRILSSNEVVQAAERTGHLIIEAYLSPNRSFVDLPKFIEEMDPLRDFGEACRRELMNFPAR